MKRVILLNNVPAPYFDPLFDKLGRESDWHLTVCYSSFWNPDVGWEDKELENHRNHNMTILDERWPKLRDTVGSPTAAAAAIFEILTNQRPSYLICYGYTLKPQMTALLLAMITRVPFAVIGDANCYCDNATGLRRKVKNFWLRLITKHAAALITIGAANRMFWESYGARRNKIFQSRFAVDNDFYIRSVNSRKRESEKLRERFGLAGKTVFLYVGRMIKRKNIDLIIKAVKQLDDNRIAFVIAGTGEERQQLEKLAAGDPRIIFAGPVLPVDLPLYYGIADALLLPARNEPWGLVINEAMACGLAVIAHRHCGAAVDLVADDNGVRLEGFSADEIAKAIEKVAADEGLRNSMKGRSREKIWSWSIDGAARGIIDAVDSTSDRRGEGIIDSVLREEK